MNTGKQNKEKKKWNKRTKIGKKSKNEQVKKHKKKQ